MKYKAIRGMEDILPEDVQIWRWLEDTARTELEFWGYEEIRTPIIEDTSVFVRSIGETTDIVTKEMYTFKDRKERSLTLRPEGTAPIARAYIEHSLDKRAPKIKRFYYIGPMFRSERPQKGRSRQFHQIGVEVIGTRSVHEDATMIIQVSKLLELFKLKNFTIKLSSLGCRKDKDTFAGKLKKYLENKKNRLCQDCKERMKRNVLRVLDCKKETCIQVMREAPNLLDSLCDTCRPDFDKVKNTLKAMKIKFEEAKNLVRGLDYYTGTVFEITHPTLGGQDAMGAGGRYDNLVKDFGGPDTGAIGYALGIERIIIALKGAKILPKPITIYIATLGDEAVLRGMLYKEHIIPGLGRNKGMKIKVIGDSEGGPLKAQMKRADKNKADITIISGQNEIEKKQVTIKNMKTGEQVTVDEGTLVNTLAEIIRKMGA